MVCQGFRRECEEGNWGVGQAQTALSKALIPRHNLEKIRGNVTAGRQPPMHLNHLRPILGQMPSQSWTGLHANVLTADVVDMASRRLGNGLTTIATAYMVLCSVAATTYSYGCLGSALEKSSSHTPVTQQLGHALRVAAQSLTATASLPPS